tara:strand:+ start:327 stop:641 length:315 start_codon:yes stop_codon:yes gene_type:complete
MKLFNLFANIIKFHFKILFLKTDYLQCPPIIKIDVLRQQELFNAKVLTLEQSAEHYKNSYFYQRKQNERFIDMHEKLLDTIQLSGKEGFIKSVVEAKKTDWDKE